MQETGGLQVSDIASRRNSSRGSLSSSGSNISREPMPMRKKSPSLCSSLARQGRAYAETSTVHGIKYAFEPGRTSLERYTYKQGYI